MEKGNAKLQLKGQELQENIDKTTTHQHFTILDLKGLHDLLVMAPVQDIKQLQDTYFNMPKLDTWEMAV